MAADDPTKAADVVPVTSSPTVTGMDGLARCPWAASAPEYVAYHDEEWGQPVHGDVALYERITLEAFQSGLSWLTILRKREGFREAFADFDPAAVANYDDHDVQQLLADKRIIRNRAKVMAAITNARALLRLRDEQGEGALDRLVWSHAPAVDGRIPPVRLDDVPAITAESRTLARTLKKHGFVFVGPTTVYAAMQACGLVNDHLTGCAFRALTQR